MKREGNRIVFERKDCHWCTEGKRPGRVVCPECNGTGKGKRGGRGGCQKCHGMRYSWSWDKPIVCELCHGNWKNSQPETYTDYMPKEIWHSLEFRVFRHERGISGNESYIGAGCVFSCVDYGAAWKYDDAEILAVVKASESHQACKVCREDGTLCQYVGIFVAPGGYSVRPVWELDATLRTIASERGVAEYMVVGAMLASEGFNGTIDALRKE